MCVTDFMVYELFTFYFNQSEYDMSIHKEKLYVTNHHLKIVLLHLITQVYQKVILIKIFKIKKYIF